MRQNSGIIIAGTGHRPNRITYRGISCYDQRVYNRLVRLCEAALKHYDPDYVISGMALGFDQALADAAVNLEIPYYAYIPFPNQEGNWPDYSQDKYRRLLAKASKRKTISPAPYAPFKMQLRNQEMSNDCTHLLALWDEFCQSGGTANCIKYHQEKHPNKPIVNVWSKWVERK